MISFGTAIFPTSCRSAANSRLRSWAAVSRSRSPTADRQLDDVAAVAAGVLVVELDDVAEQQRGAAVGGAELERLIDPPRALAGEQPQQPHERQLEQHRSGMVDGHATRSRSRSGPARRPRRRPTGWGGASRAGGHRARRARRRAEIVRVEGEHGEQREHVDRPVPRLRRGDGGRAEDERGRDRVPRLAEGEDRARAEPAGAAARDQRAEHRGRRRRAAGTSGAGDEEQHRHQDEEERARVARADLEADLAGDRVEDDQERAGAERDVAVGGQHERHRDRDQREGEGHQRLDRELALVHRGARARPRGLDQPLGLGVLDRI